jgi:DNA-binding transcriptional LysR family regulator
MLEGELGVELFRRVPQGMRLTEEGQYLKQALEHPLELVNIALRNVRTHAVPVEASLVLGLPPVIAQAFGPRLVSRLQRDLPNLKLRVAEADSGRLSTDLARGVVDIALLVGMFPAEKLFHAEIISERLMLVVPPNSDLARQKAISFAQMATLPLILPGTQAGLRTQLAKTELASDVTLNVIMEIDSAELRKKAVQAGLGYALLPPVALKQEIAEGTLAVVSIIEPEIEQIIRWSVRPNWRVARGTYDQVQRSILEEWHAAVIAGEWPARWLIDLEALKYTATSLSGNGTYQG